MVIDNFENLIRYLKFEDEFDFYYLQIIQRRKENPGLDKSEKVIKDYYIDSLDYLMKKRNQIITLCKTFNARAYLRLNVRNYQDISYRMNKLLADYLYSGQYKSCLALFDRVAGRYHADKDRTWIIDIDTKEGVIVGDTCKIIEDTQPVKDGINKVVDIIETKNGFHLITKPFNVQKFNDEIKQKPSLNEVVEIHKDNPTILYIP